MLYAVHLLFLAAYVCAPPLAIAIAFLRARPNDLRHVSRLFFTIFVAKSFCRFISPPPCC
jgi:hypothetical protein